MKVILTLLCVLLLVGCSMNPYSLNDPTKFVWHREDLQRLERSIRCEIVTYLVINRLQSKINTKLRTGLRSLYFNDPSEFNARVPLVANTDTVDIDAAQPAYIQIKFQNLNTLDLGLSAGIDHADNITTSSAGHSIGVAYNDAGTYIYQIPFIIPQDSDLGPSDSYTPSGFSVPSAYVYTSVYNFVPSSDASFYCYKPLAALSDRSTLEHAYSDVYNLAANMPLWSDFAQFRRIYVGDMTLAAWLQRASSETSKVEKTIFPTPENMIIGQLNYQFSLVATPKASYGWKFVAQQLNPLNLTASASQAHMTSLSVILNTVNSKTVSGAASGQATCVGTPQTRGCRSGLAAN